MAISNDILSSTLAVLMAEAQDSLYRATPLLSRIQKNKGIKIVDGGSKLSQPVVVKNHSSITQLSTGTGGYDSVSLTVADCMRPADFDWCDFTAPILISRVEELSNKGPQAIVNIAEERMRAVMGMLQREWELQVIKGSSTVLTNLQSLNGVDAATGWLEEGAFGAQTNTVGGLAKSSYTDTWQNQVADVTSTFSTTGRKKMYNLRNAAGSYVMEGGTDIILASPVSFELFQTDADTQVRYTPEDNIGNSNPVCKFAGADMFYEPNLPYVGATNTLSMYFLNSKGLGIAFDKDANFKLLPFEWISGQDVRAARLAVRTQLFAKHLASQGVLLNSEV
tara:strand:+ start:3806 stop:4813 length:1008 start_codon:yes stop_codon:yes gene_type:complete